MSQIFIAYIYLRVSSLDQERSGLGIAAQKERCLAMATVKGWTVPENCIFSDEGVSGTLSERPELDRLLDAIRKQPPTAVIISSLDRLGRRRQIIQDLVEEIGRVTDLVSCKESFDTTTAAGRFVLNIFMDLAELERDQISERTTEGMASLKGRGMQCGSIPYGYQRGEGRDKLLSDGKKKTVYPLVENAAEQEVISIARNLRESGISIRGIAQELNQRGIATRTNGSWQKTQIARMLER